MELDKPNFSEALYSLKAGFKIARKAWPEDRFLEEYNSVIHDCMYGRSSFYIEPYFPSSVDLLAEDWHIYEDSEV